MMNLVKTSVLNFCSMIVKIFTGLLLNKIMAVYIGPSGYALASQFQNGINFATAFATGGINTGLTKYSAEFSSDDTKLQSIWRTSVIFSLVSTIIISLSIYLSADWVSLKYLKSDIYAHVIKWFSLTLFLFVANVVLISIVNGKKMMGKYVLINISGSLVSLIFSGFMAWKYGLSGAFISFATNQSIVFFITLFLLRNESWLKWDMFIGLPTESCFFKKLARFSLMAIVSAFCVTYLQIMIRSYLVNKFGLEFAGYWDGAWRISSIYLMLVTVPLSVYYLPRLSEVKEKKLLLDEILQGYKILFPVVIFSAAFIYLFRTVIVSVLFTSDFHPMKDLMGWQLLGDVTKLGSWLLSYVMLSKALTKTYIFTEIVSSIIFYSLVHYYCSQNGLVGVPQAYFTTYAIYWVMMIIVFISYIKRERA